MRLSAWWAAVLLAAVTAHPPSCPAQQTDTAVGIGASGLQQLLEAEDARGAGPLGVDPLLAALGSSDTALRQVAIRGLGRLQRPDLGARLLPALADPRPSIRAEAANAVAQSVRGVPRTGHPSPDGLDTRGAAAALTRALAAETDPSVASVLARSLGRLPLPDSAAARAAETAIRARFAGGDSPGLAHGLYTLARARRATGNLTLESLVRLRGAAVGSPDALMRRLALLALVAADGLDSTTVVRAVGDPDPETRRIALRGLPAMPQPLRTTMVRRALADSSMIVRIGAVAAAATRRGDTLPDCGPLVTLLRDRAPYVSLAAIDSLGDGCAGRAAAAVALRQLVQAHPADGPPDHRWQAGAHALVSLARLRPASARPLLPGAATADRPEVRIYAARAAAALHAPTVLYRLSRDPDHNVQEAAVAGLAATVGHRADRVYRRLLRSDGHQIVLAAANALEGTTDPSALADVLAALDRLTAQRRENSRDPRLVLLARVGSLGDSAAGSRLRPYLADYDTAVAAGAAATLERWTGGPVKPRAEPLPLRREPLAEIFRSRLLRIRVTMAESSGGGSFTIRLLSTETPATVARVLRLAREGFYAGSQFQRVEPNFVVQGGGPDASEYVGDSTFMRDELTLRSHARGTVGISTRGRDTGDGQWFINLVDNPILDHEYTIFGRIDSGWPVVERILEGDRIAEVEILQQGP